MRKKLFISLLRVRLRLRIEQRTIGVKVAQVGEVGEYHRIALQRDHAVIGNDDDINGKMQQGYLGLEVSNHGIHMMNRRSHLVRIRSIGVPRMINIGVVESNEVWTKFRR